MPELLRRRPLGGEDRIGGERRAEHVGGIDDHRAELQTSEPRAARADPLVREDRRSAVASDEDREHGHDRCREHEKKGRDDEIERPLAEARHELLSSAANGEHDRVVIGERRRAPADNGKRIEPRQQEEGNSFAQQTFDDAAFVLAVDPGCHHDAGGTMRLQHLPPARCVRNLPAEFQPEHGSDAVARPRLGAKDLDQRRARAGAFHDHHRHAPEAVAIEKDLRPGPESDRERRKAEPGTGRKANRSRRLQDGVRTSGDQEREKTGLRHRLQLATEGKLLGILARQRQCDGDRRRDAEAERRLVRAGELADAMSERKPKQRNQDQEHEKRRAEVGQGDADRGCGSVRNPSQPFLLVRRRRPGTSRPDIDFAEELHRTSASLRVLTGLPDPHAPGRAAGSPETPDHRQRVSYVTGTVWNKSLPLLAGSLSRTKNVPDTIS